MTNPQIAEIRSVATATVKAQASAVLAKLGIADRRELVGRPDLLDARDTTILHVLDHQSAALLACLKAVAPAATEVGLGDAADEIERIIITGTGVEEVVLNVLHGAGTALPVGPEAAIGVVVSMGPLPAVDVRVALALVENRRRPLSVVLAEEVFRRCIEDHARILSDNYEPLDELGGTFYFDSGPRPSARRRRRTAVSSIGRLVDLEDPVVLTGFDVHVQDFRQRLGGRTDLVTYLEAGLAMSRTAVLHCADPARLPAVAAALSEYGEFLSDGSIAMLMGHSMTSLVDDFPTYMRETAAEYLPSGEAMDDLDSLSAPFRDEAQLSAALDVLASCTVAVKRGYRGKHRFSLTVRGDLEPAEGCVMTALPSSREELADLSVWQLLFARLALDESIESVLPQADAAQIVHDLVALSDAAVVSREVPISRRIVLSAIESRLTERTSAINYLTSLIEARVHRLYFGATFAGLPGAEIDPRRDAWDPLNFRYLSEHLEHLTDGEVALPVGPDRLSALRAADQWWEFVDYHLLTLHEAFRRARLTGDHPSDVLPGLWTADQREFSALATTYLNNARHP